MTTLPHTLRPLVALAVCLSLATPAFAATTPPANPAATGTPVQLLDVQLSDSTITISGLAVHDVVVRLHLASPVGIFTGSVNPNDPISTPGGYLSRTSAGRGQVDYVPFGLFSRTSGTAQDGWWETVVPVTSALDGTLTVTSVYAQSTDAVSLDNDPRHLGVDPRTLGIDAHVQVTGLHIPHFTIHQTPDPLTVGQDVTFFGTVTDLDTGAPFAGVSAGANFDTACLGGGAGGVLTSSKGNWRQTYRKWNFVNNLKCAGAGLLSPTGSGFAAYAYASDGHGNGYTPNYREWVATKPAVSTVKVGGTVAINGRSSAMVERVVLQRLVGRRWRTVGTTIVRITGRFTLVAQPPAVGSFHYRVLRPATRYHEFPATSAQLNLVAR